LARLDPDLRFGRGIIRSCAKLDYGTAQRVIDARDAGRTGAAELEEAAAVAGGPVKVSPKSSSSSSGWNPEAVAESIGHLNGAARAMRRRRFADGALRLDQSKLSFELDHEGNPSGARAYVMREANQLVEEFMLLANRTVAKFISEAGTLCGAGCGVWGAG
jgi:DIS3-like exonuclease 2